MVKLNRNQLRIANYHDDFDQSQLVRKSPTLYRLSTVQRDKIEKFADDYMSFLSKVKIAPDVVDEVRNIVEKSGIEAKFVEDDDKTAFALIKYGKRPMREGLRIIYAHTDSPCLKAKAKPIIITWDPDEQILHTGIELDMFGYGGINPHQWTGRKLNMAGWAIIDGQRIKINFDAYSPETSAHTDTRAQEGIEFGQAHLEEDLDLITGFKSRDEFLKSIGLKSQEDWARARVYGVPVSSPSRIGPCYISGYGHDDRACLYSAVRAFIDSKKVPQYTTLVCGFDLEEVGSKGMGGADSKFFDRVVNECLIEREEVSGLEHLTEALKIELARKSLTINADVDVAASGRDADHDRIDIHNVPIFGYGAFMYCPDGIMDSDQTSPRVVDRMMNIFKGTDVIFQPVGLSMTADQTYGIETMNKFFEQRGYPTLNFGVAVAALHSPEELVHIGDLYHNYRAYQIILDKS